MRASVVAFAPAFGLVVACTLAAPRPPAEARPLSSIFFWSAREVADSLAGARGMTRLGVEIGQPTWSGAEVIVPVRLARPVDPALRRMLFRGVPATCELRVELWQVRPRWFDTRVATQALSWRVRYDLWRERWHVRGPDAVETSIADTVALDRMLAGWRIVRLALPHGASPHRGYYAVARARVGPLSDEDLAEMADWLERPPVPRVSGGPTQKASARTPVFHGARAANLSKGGGVGASTR